MQPGGLDSIVELEKLVMAQSGGLALPAQQSMIISCPKKMVGRYIANFVASLCLSITNLSYRPSDSKMGSH